MNGKPQKKYFKTLQENTDNNDATQWRISRSGITSPQQSMAEKKYTLDEYPGKFDKAVPLDLKGFR